jgi:two-component system cell cycle response regulator
MAGRVLVVDDVATNRLLLTLLLSKAFYDVDEAESGEDALILARRSPPDLALVDLRMPGMSGFELCRRMKRDPALADVPVVIITGAGAQSDRVEALEAGADDFLTKPVRDEALFARIRALMRMKAMTDELKLRDQTMRGLLLEAPPRGLIDPPAGARVIGVTSPDNGAVMRAILAERLDIDFAIARSAREAFAMAADAPPEAMLIDAAGLPEFSPAFCAALRQRPETRASGLIALVPENDALTAAACIDAGVNDYAQWPLEPSELTARLRTQLRHKAFADHLRDSVADGLRMAVTDPLTGLRNRRYLDAHLDQMIARALAQTQPLCVMAFDLDRFKAVNDTYGHAAGDAILRQFAERLSANTRSVDLVARTGGEEFVVAMPEAGLPDARIAAERVRAAVERPGFDIGDRAIDMTVSVGVAALRRRGDGAERLLARADAALYAAKAAGRNRVIFAAA